jgi:ATP-dependent protease ClpP protease subunit
MPRIIIPISGIIANFEFENESNVTPASLRKSLEAANGEDILVTINSPGGGVFPGLEMFSLLQNYSGNVETRIVSLAASMGSVLALAGDKKSAENTAMYFVHNAQGIGIGDYRDLASESEWLRDISELIANLYAEYTNLSLSEAQEYMDEDSHFFGNDLELLGFEIVDSGSEPNESAARVNAKKRKQDARAKMSDEQYIDNLEKAAACIDYEKFGIKNKPSDEKLKIKVPTGDVKNIALNSEYNKNRHKTETNPAAAGENKREVNMTLSEFLKENPSAQAEYDTAIAESKKAGEEAVNARIETASKYVANTDYPESIREIAVKAMKGEVDEVSLTASVAAFDAAKEAINSQQAQAETVEHGDISGDEPPKVSEDGIVRNGADHVDAVARIKNKRGA